MIAGGLSYGGIGIFYGTTASAELYTPACSANDGAICPADTWQQAITLVKAAAGTNSLNFWQWAWYWEKAPAFNGAPARFGMGEYFSPDLMAQIIAAGGGGGSQLISAEQWVSYFRQVIHQ